MHTLQYITYFHKQPHSDTFKQNHSHAHEVLTFFDGKILYGWILYGYMFVQKFHRTFFFVTAIYASYRINWMLFGFLSTFTFNNKSKWLTVSCFLYTWCSVGIEFKKIKNRSINHLKTKLWLRINSVICAVSQCIFPILLSFWDCIPYFMNFSLTKFHKTKLHGHESWRLELFS